MAVEEKKGVQVFLIMLRDVDLQKAYDIGNEVVVRNGGIFHGLNVFSITGNPPRDKQSMSFLIDSSRIGLVVDETAKGLGLSPSSDLLVQAFPSTQFVPRSRPPQTAS